MNIHFIDRNIQMFFCENFLSSLTPQEKKVAAIALGIFSFLALVYCFVHCYLFKATPLESGSDSPTQIDDIFNENGTVKGEERLFIIGLDGKRWIISILLSDTVSDLKKKIYEQPPYIPVEKQRLLFKKKQMNDSATLEDCKVRRKHNEILLVLKIPPR